MSTKHSDSSGYEKSDARPKVVIYFLIILTVLIVVSFAAMAVLLKGMQTVEEKTDAPQYFVKDERWSPPAVGLETHPSDQYRKLQEAEQEILTTYGWINPAEKRVRIPVERAKTLVLEAGFPVRREAAEAPVQAESAPETVEENEDTTKAPVQDAENEKENHDS